MATIIYLNRNFIKKIKSHFLKITNRYIEYETEIIAERRNTLRNRSKDICENRHECLKIKRFNTVFKYINNYVYYAHGYAEYKFMKVAFIKANEFSKYISNIKLDANSIDYFQIKRLHHNALHNMNRYINACKYQKINILNILYNIEYAVIPTEIIKIIYKYIY